MVQLLVQVENGSLSDWFQQQVVHTAVGSRSKCFPRWLAEGASGS